MIKLDQTETPSSWWYKNYLPLLPLSSESAGLTPIFFCVEHKQTLISLFNMVKIKLSSVFILAAFVIAPIAAIPLPSSSTPTHPGTGDAHHDTNPADHQ